MPSNSPQHLSVSLEQLGASVEQKAWDIFHAALEPVIRAGKMGAVVFQFQLSFLDSKVNRDYVEHCRKMLSPGLTMAVEFRNRAWYTGEGEGLGH